MALDTYGGYDDIPVTNIVAGTAGYFRVGLLGNRYVLVTPSGNAFYMNGIQVLDNNYYLNWSGTIAPMYNKNATIGPVLEWASVMCQRMKSKGYNTLGNYVTRCLLPVKAYGFSYVNQTQLPFLFFTRPGTYCRPPVASGGAAMKNLTYGGIDRAGGFDWGPQAQSSSYPYTGYKGGLADFFDPSWVTFCVSRIATLEASTFDASVNVEECPWMIAITTDDSDVMSGLIKTTGHFHVGWCMAVNAPFQSASYDVGWAQRLQKHSDPKVHSKFAWREFLVGRHGTATAITPTFSSTGATVTFTSAHGVSAGNYLKCTSGEESGQVRKILSVDSTTMTLERPFHFDISAGATASWISASGALTAILSAWAVGATDTPLPTYTTLDCVDVDRTGEPIRELSTGVASTPLSNMILAPITTTASSTAITSAIPPVTMSHIYGSQGETDCEAYVTLTGCTWYDHSVHVLVPGIESTDAGLIAVLVGGGQGGSDDVRTINLANATNQDMYVFGEYPVTEVIGNGVVKVYRGKFTAADVNALLTITGAGTDGADLETRVASVTDAGHFSIDDQIVTTVSDTTGLLSRGPFSPSCLNRMLAIPGAGPSGATMQTAIVSITDPTHATLGHAADTAVGETALGVTVSTSGTTATFSGAHGMSVGQYLKATSGDESGDMRRVASVPSTTTITLASAFDTNLTAGTSCAKLPRGTVYLDLTYGTTNANLTDMWAAGERLAYTVCAPQRYPPYNPDNAKNNVTLKCGGTAFATDNGSGTLTGATIASGTVDYTTMTVSFTLSTPLTDGGALTIDYKGNGWGHASGTGLMDESGRSAWMAATVNSHNWTDATRDYLLRSTSWMYSHFPAVWADLEAFCPIVAREYIHWLARAIRDRYPNHLLGNVDAVSWNCRPDVLAVLGDYCDIMEAGSLGSDMADLMGIGDPDLDPSDPVFQQAVAAAIRLVYDGAGKPVFYWVGCSANLDSELGDVTNGGQNPLEPNATVWPTQEKRGECIAMYIDTLMNATGTDGKYPYLGFEQWALHDSTGERLNWGLVTRGKDNLFDGVECRAATSEDAYGYTRGGEAQNNQGVSDYGDYFSSVTAAINRIYSTLTGELPEVAQTAFRWRNDDGVEEAPL